MARPPYRIARQEHIGTALNDLVQRGVVQRWRFEYDEETGTAYFDITTKAKRTSELDSLTFTSTRLTTRDTEKFVQARYDELMVRWKAVPHPGSAKHLRETLAWIAEG